MKELMEVWRRKVLEPSRLEDEEKQRLEIDVDAVPGEFKPKDKVSIEVVDDEADLEEWNRDDDDEYPSRKKRKRDKAMLKPGNNASTWHHGKEELDTLGNGIAEKKKPVKVNCHNYSPYHSGKDGKFVDPDKEAGSYSMAKPDADSSDDCTWGQSSRKSANRSRQAVKAPCGRGAKYRCRDGSEKWEEQLETEGIEQQDAAYLRGIISQELQKALRQQMQGSGCTFQQLVRAMTLWASAEKGGGKEK